MRSAAGPRRPTASTSVTYHLAGVNNEDGWLGDAAFLAGVVDAPVPNDATLGIAQNRKRQTEVNPQGLRCVGCIHRDSHYARARRPDFQVALSVVRQLAEAERSPITAIEEQHQAAVRDQLRQPPRRSCRVWQFEFPCKFARDGNLCHRPSLTLRLDASGYFDYTRRCRASGDCRGKCPSLPDLSASAVKRNLTHSHQIRGSEESGGASGDSISSAVKYAQSGWW